MIESLEVTSDPEKRESPEKLKFEDQLKHYQEGRTDVRSYATFLIQIITLLLTTMILVLGWVAKDYATEKYRLAQRAVIPESIAVSQLARQNQANQKPIYELPPVEAEQRLRIEERKFDYINQVYWRQLIYSPTTSLLLSGFSAFTLLVLGLLIAITYQLQRRRYHYHALGLKLGLESDQPVADAILIKGALNDLMILIGIAAMALILVTAIQTLLYVFHTNLWSVRFSLIFVLLLVLAKTVFVSQMVASYTHFERTEGWKARWRRAHCRVELLQNLSQTYLAFPDSSTEKLRRLNHICAAESKSNWEEAGKLLHDLLFEVRSASIDSKFEDHVHALFIELRHNRLWRRR